ncbi:MAG: M6 family metalloprotease domain-containing protein [Bacteroidota bacterium]
MKTIRFFLVAVILCGFGAHVSAAYLEFVPQQYTQPDGTILNCYATGDEYYHWLHDAQRYTIVYNPETGYFVYAAKQGDVLVPTRLVPGRDDPSSSGLTPGLNISSEKYRELFSQKFKEPAFKTGRSFTTTGAYNNLVVFIRFSDQPEYTESLNVYSSQFNGTNTVSMTEYFKEVSKNQLNLSTTFYPNPSGTTIVSYQDTHPRRYYQPYSVSNQEGYRTDIDYINREMTLLRNAVLFVKAEVEASGIDYDHDNDKKVDNVCFIVKGKTDGWSDMLWPHQWYLYDDYAVSINDAIVYDFNFQLSEALGVSVLCHEMFHSLGAPDLYRYENDDITPVGPWDLMAHDKTPPQHMSAYMKMKYGKWFSQIPSITADGEYSLKPLSQDGYAAYKIASPNSTSEFFVVEYRKAEGRFESSLVGTGLIIYRVNQSLEGNADGPPDEVYVYRPNGTTRNNGNINAAPFSSTLGRTDFADNTNPSCFLSNGSPGGIKISNIGEAGSTIKFTVGSGGAFNPPRNLTATLTGSNVTLAWEKPVSGNGTLSGFKVFRNQTVIATPSDPNVLTYTDPNLADGTYQYQVTARYTSPTGESVPSNAVTVSVGGSDKPDLVITDPAILPVNVEPGGTVSLSCTLHNDGAAEAGSSTLRIYLSTDEIFDSGDRQLAWGAMNALSAGATIDVSGENITVPETIADGKWFVLFLADADGAVAESIENNNQASTILNIGNPALNPPRNLVAQVAQTTIRLNWQEPDPGGGTLAGFAVYRNSIKVSTINDPAWFEFFDPGLTLGTYTYYVTAIYSSPAGESAKSNEVTVTVTNEAKPDLTIQDFLVTPGTVVPGGSIDITCTLLNIGGNQAPANQVQVYLSQDLTIDANDLYLAYGTMDPLDAGDQVSISGEDIALPDEIESGTWYTLIMADGLNEIQESNENNNVASQILVIEGETADLQIVNVSFYPLVITPSTNVRVSGIVYNGGDATASSVKITFYLSSDEIFDGTDKKLVEESTRILVPKATIKLSGNFTLQSSVTPGQYFLIGLVDKDNAVNESDETNNQSITPVIVAGTTGITDDALETSLVVYPVPATEWLNIRLPSLPGEDAIVRITDLYGRVAYLEKVGPNSARAIEINVKGWSSGVYFICFQTEDKNWVKKVVIQ